MLLIKRITVIICSKNYKSKFKFVEIIHEKVWTFFPDTHRQTDRRRQPCQ